MMMKSLVGLGLLLTAVTAHAATPEADRASVVAFKQAFGRAVATNDVKAIEPFLASDWRVIEVAGEKISRQDYLGVIRDGSLKYQSLEGRDLDIRIYGDTAVVTGHALAKGSFDGKPFASDEISSEVLIRRQGRWQFVLTHLTTFKP